MKKENKKMAQERRAEEKREEQLRVRRNQILYICIGILLLVLLATILVETNGSSGTTTTIDATNGELSTDSSLTAEDGDTVNIDYVGSIDGVEFAGGSTDGTGTDLTIGSGTYIDNFEEQLIGSHPGDTVDVNVTFPEDYGNEDLNGQDALFVVTVNGIYQ